MDQYIEIRKERDYFPALKNSAYFETPSTGLVPQYVYDAVKAYQDARLYEGGDSLWGEKQLSSIEMMAAAKKTLAEMMHCSAEEIVFGGNTSEIMAHYIGSVRLTPGSNVVMAENTFTSGRYLWQMREKDGLEIRYAKATDGNLMLEDLCRLADENTVAIHCDYVNSSTGFRINAEKIGAFCKDRGIRFIVDGTQALGAMPVDVQAMQADLVAGNNYKWMLGYCGTGYGYISRELWDDIEQRTAGWMSDQHRFYEDTLHVVLRDDGGRFELGYPNVSGLYGLLLTSKAYNRLGADRIKAYLMHLRSYLVEKADAASGIKLCYQFEEENYSQIVHLLVKDAKGLTYDILKEAGVKCNIYEEEENTRLRIGLHYYNNEEDIDQLFAVISNTRCKK